MSRRPPAASSDDHLRQLLDVEERVRAQVQTAREEAAHLLADARARSERRRTEAIDEARRADERDAAAERRAQEQAAAEAETAHQRAIEKLEQMAEAHVDARARWLLARAIEVEDGAP